MKSSSSGMGDLSALMHFEAGKKSVGAAYLLFLFLGGVGGHRFYCGFPISAIVMAFLTVTSLAAGGAPLILLAVWLLFDAFAIPRWIRRYNTKLATKLTPPSVDKNSQTPPPIRDAGAGERIRQKQTQPATRQGWRTAGYFALAGSLVWLIVLAPSMTPSKQNEEPPQTATSGVTTAFLPGQNWKDKEAIVLNAVAPPSGPVIPGPKALAAAPGGEWNAIVQSSSEPGQADAKAIPAKEITVPSDMKARYYAESVSITKAGRARIVSKRIGPSGTSYSNRECDCGRSTYRTLGDGETLDEMQASTPEQKMVKLVHDGNGFGSISFHVCDHACKATGSAVSRTQAKKSGPITAQDIDRLLSTVPAR